MQIVIAGVTVCGKWFVELKKFTGTTLLSWILRKHQTASTAVLDRESIKSYLLYDFEKFFCGTTSEDNFVQMKILYCKN